MIDFIAAKTIKGFPDASEDSISILSKEPYYTACPNMNIKDFIKAHGSEYTDDDIYECEPYTDDIAEDKHDLIYNIHGYYTKVPPKAISTYIQHYTKPGDVILDAFCGSGMTGVASQLCGNRSAVLCDLSPYATFIASNYNTPNSNTIIEELNRIIEDIEDKYGRFYLTRHKEGNIYPKDINGNYIMGKINYVVWSCVYYCPNCGKEFVYHDILRKYHIKSTQKKFNCPYCNMEIERSKLEQKRELSIDKELGVESNKVLRVPTEINYSIGTTRYTKEPDEYDLELIKEIEDSKIDGVPVDKMIHGDETERLYRAGVEYVKDLYVRRALFFIAKVYNECKEDNKKLFLLTSALPKLTILNRYMPEHGSRALVGPRAGTYYLPPLCVENDVIGQLKFQLRKLQNLSYKQGNVIVSTQSATDLSNIDDNSIDYVFIDPPFGANIMYSELSFLPESWLGVHTNNTDEAIINKSQRKEISEYQTMMSQSFSELFRVLKPGRWMTLEFHNSKNAIWNSIQEALSVAGFIVADVRTLNKEKKTINQFTAQGCVDQDLVISAYKPQNNFTNEFKKSIGTEETAWAFVRQHLEKLKPVIISNGKIEINAERQNILLFDRMVAYHIVNGIPVPVDSNAFYRGLNEKFLQRDNMFFLPDQINEYDTARIKSDVEPIQMELFVTNEKTAIAWLYKELDKPQTYSELQPKFMQEVKSVDKYEKIPELTEILEENFLCDEKGRWYIPDVNKDTDLVKLREKKLIKEFDTYLQTKGKIKLFRSEAIRAGFAKLWDDKNYKLIVETAERLPESLIQEDDKLLMYYDLSCGRI